MAAVGSYGTGIEIWDLDVLDSVEPAAVLGGPVAGADGAAAPKQKKKGSKKVTDRQQAAGEAELCFPSAQLLLEYSTSSFV